MRVAVAVLALIAFAAAATAPASAKAAARPMNLPLSTNPHPDPLKRVRWTLPSSSGGGGSGSSSAQQSLVPIFTGSGEFYATIGLGTPPQPVTVILDSGSSTLAVPAAGCSGCTVPGAFNPAVSPTAAQVPCSSPMCTGGCALSSQAPNACGFGVGYADGSGVWGALMTDVLTVGTLSAPAISFGLFWNSTATFQTPPAQGIMGLAYKAINCNPPYIPASGVTPPANNTGTCNPVSITSLLAYNGLPNVFGLCMATNSSTAGLPAGQMTLGGVDALYYTGDIRWSPVIQQSFYAVQLFDVQVQGVSIGLPFSVYNNFGTIVDSGTTELVLAEPSFTAVRNATRDALNAFSNGASNNCDFFSECCAQSLFPTVAEQNGPLFQPLQLSFQLNGVLLNLPLSGYLSCGENAGCDAGFCTMSGIAPGPASDGIIIGQTVMQFYYTIFDRSAPRVGFAAAACSRTCSALTSGGCASCTASPSCAWCGGSCVSITSTAVNSSCQIDTCVVPPAPPLPPVSPYPSVTKIAPGMGPAAGGNVLLLSGVAMDQLTSVSVNGVSAELFALSGRTAVPSAAGGSGDAETFNTTAVIVPAAVYNESADPTKDMRVWITARYRQDTPSSETHYVGQYVYLGTPAAPQPQPTPTPNNYLTEDDVRGTRTLSVVAIVLSLLAIAVHISTAVRSALRERSKASSSGGDDRHRELLS